MTSLSDSYLAYANRRLGQDQDRYAYTPMGNHEPLALKSGDKLGVSIIVPLEYFMLNPSGKPFKHPGAMVTPYPDLRHYTTRDYGNRVGAFRLLKAFQNNGIKATFAVNAALLDRVAPLIDAIRADGHEIAAHGFDTDSIHWGGLDLATEEEYVRKTRDAFAAHNLHPTIWMSPARQQSNATLDLVKKYGFDICLDWETDRQPTLMKTSAGAITGFPVLNELDDRTLLIKHNHSEEEWHKQIVDAADFMLEEAHSQGAGVMGFCLTPYIAGLPYRLWAVRQILRDLSALEGVMVNSVGTILRSLGPR